MALKSNKQQAFCEEYIVDYNGTAAAIRAGYSPKTAQVAASGLIAKPHVKAEIDRLRAIKSKRTGVTRERIMEELAKIAFCDTRDILNPDGSLRSDAAPEDSACVQQVITRTYPDGSKEQQVKFHDKTKALDILCKLGGEYLGQQQNQIDINRNKDLAGILVLPAVVDVPESAIEVVSESDQETGYTEVSPNE